MNSSAVSETVLQQDRLRTSSQDTAQQCSVRSLHTAQQFSRTMLTSEAAGASIVLADLEITGFSTFSSLLSYHQDTIPTTEAAGASSTTDTVQESSNDTVIQQEDECGYEFVSPLPVPTSDPHEYNLSCYTCKCSYAPSVKNRPVV